MNHDSELAVATPSASLVPTGYAEKAMASLMQLHSELMDEKERRVELFRRLMEKEQAVAELRMYVKLLEERLEKPAPRVAVPMPAPRAVMRVAPLPAPAPASDHVLRAAPRLESPPPAPTPIPRAPPRPPTPHSDGPAPAVAAGGRRPLPTDGWKTW